MSPRGQSAGARASWGGAAGALAWVLITACATAPATVSKIVAGKVIVTRAVHPDAYEHVARAQLYQQEERWEQAIDELERALRFDRDAPEIHAEIAEIELELGRLDRAEKAAQKSLSIEETTSGLIALGHLRQRRNDLAGAVVALRQAADRASFEQSGDVASAAYLELADAQLELLDLTGARDTLVTLADEVPASTVARVRLAGVLWSLGAMSDVERRLREAITIEPNHIEALLTLAWLATANGQVEVAHKRFSDALERAEGALDVAAAFARFLMLAGRGGEAAEISDDLASNGDDETLLDRIELFRSAHRQDRALELLRTRRGKSDIAEDFAARLDLIAADLVADKAPHEALALLLRVPKSAPSYTLARLRAVELLRLGDKAGEARKLLAEIDKDPPSDGLRDDIVVAHAGLDEKDKNPSAALERLGKAIAARPKSVRLRLARAALHDRMGRVTDALAEAEALLVHDPGSAEALNFWGFLAADHKIDLPRAKKRIQAALAFDPGSGAILDSLGWAHLQLGEVKEATLFLGQAGRLEPEDPEILGHLAALHERKGELALALQHVKRALSQTPEPPLRDRLEVMRRRLESGDKVDKVDKTGKEAGK